MIDPSVHRILHMYQNMDDHGNDHAHLCPNHNGVHSITFEKYRGVQSPMKLPNGQRGEQLRRKTCRGFGGPIRRQYRAAMRQQSNRHPRRLALHGLQIVGHVAVG